MAVALRGHWCVAVSELSFVLLIGGGLKGTQWRICPGVNVSYRIVTTEIGPFCVLGHISSGKVDCGVAACERSEPMSNCDNRYAVN